MQRNKFLKNTFSIGATLFLGLFLTAANQEPKIHHSSSLEANDQRPTASRSLTDRPGPEVDFTKAHLLWASYEKTLPQAKASRGQTLAELARLGFILGEWRENGDRRNYYEKGRDYAELLCLEHPLKVEGHYWLALILAGLAEMSRVRRALLLVPVIVNKLEIATRLDGTYNQAAPHRTLGRLYFRAPPWPLSVGDLQKSVFHLRLAVKLAPENSTNYLYLAETLLEMGQTGKACRELERVGQATTNAQGASGLNEDRQEALRLLKECRQAK
jgi:hypothetical protein